MFGRLAGVDRASEHLLDGPIHYADLDGNAPEG
jgi:hypothetical protein